MITCTNCCSLRKNIEPKLTMKESLPFLLKSLLKKCGIMIDYNELEFQLLSHPTFPSLHSVTGVLDHFSIRNLALEAPRTEDSIAALPVYFLARVHDRHGERFALVTKKQSGFLLLIDESKSETLTVNQFLEVWTGLVAVVEKDEIDTTPRAADQEMKNWFSYLALAVIVSVPLLVNPGLAKAIHFVLSVIGLAVSVLIVQHELGVESAMLTRFCEKENSNLSCDSVLKNSGSSLLGLIKLSDLALIYFSGLVLSGVLITLRGTTYTLLTLLAIPTIPVIFYSLYYQYRVIKKWCLLCLGIVAVLAMQVTSVLIAGIRASAWDLQSALLILLSFLCASSVWQLLSRQFPVKSELNRLKVSHFKFKRNYRLFKSLLTQSSYVYAQAQKQEIVFGDRTQHARLKIMVITNPSCGHCREAHALIQPLLSRYGKQIQVCIRFNVNTTTPGNLSVRAAARLLEIYHTRGEQIGLQALHEIYGGMDTETFLHKWHEVSDSSYQNILKEESAWCQLNKIDFTPEILINGFSFPNEYDRSDLLYFIDDLLEDARPQAENVTPLAELMV